MGLGFNIMHLHLGDNIPTLSDDQKKLDDYLKNIFEYFRRESRQFLENLVEHYGSPLEDYAVAYYVFMPVKVLIYAMFIFRIFSAVSVINKVKISFEEYSITRRGLPLAILFFCLLSSNLYQLDTFKTLEKNTASTLSLAAGFINRSADLRYTAAFIFESAYFQTPKYDGVNDIIASEYSRIEKNEDRIFNTAKLNINLLSYHFQE